MPRNRKWLLTIIILPLLNLTESQYLVLFFRIHPQVPQWNEIYRQKWFSNKGQIAKHCQISIPELIVCNNRIVMFDHSCRGRTMTHKAQGVRVGRVGLAEFRYHSKSPRIAKHSPSFIHLLAWISLTTFRVNNYNWCTPCEADSTLSPWRTHIEVEFIYYAYESWW